MSSRTALLKRLPLLFLIALAVFAVGVHGVAAAAAYDSPITDTVSLPGGLDSNLATSAILVIVGLAVVLVGTVMGLKLLPLAVRYIFKWIRKA